jgi:hypothetical protein
MLCTNAYKYYYLEIVVDLGLPRKGNKLSLLK